MRPAHGQSSPDNPRAMFSRAAPSIEVDGMPAHGVMPVTIRRQHCHGRHYKAVRQPGCWTTGYFTERRGGQPCWTPGAPASVTKVPMLVTPEAGSSMLSTTK